MKKNIYKLHITTAVFLVCFIFPDAAHCKRGCCSHHGGVCLGKCCDGTPLSERCRGTLEESSISSEIKNEPYESKSYPSAYRLNEISNNPVTKCICNGSVTYTNHKGCPRCEEKIH